MATDVEDEEDTYMHLVELGADADTIFEVLEEATSTAGPLGLKECASRCALRMLDMAANGEAPICDTTIRKLFANGLQASLDEQREPSESAKQLEELAKRRWMPLLVKMKGKAELHVCKQLVRLARAHHVAVEVFKATSVVAAGGDVEPSAAPLACALLPNSAPPAADAAVPAAPRAADSASVEPAAPPAASTAADVAAATVGAAAAAADAAAATAGAAATAADASASAAPMATAPLHASPAGASAGAAAVGCAPARALASPNAAAMRTACQADSSTAERNVAALANTPAPAARAAFEKAAAAPPRRALALTQERSVPHEQSRPSSAPPRPPTPKDPAPRSPSASLPVLCSPFRASIREDLDTPWHAYGLKAALMKKVQSRTDPKLVGFVTVMGNLLRRTARCSVAHKEKRLRVADELDDAFSNSGPLVEDAQNALLKVLEKYAPPTKHDALEEARLINTNAAGSALAFRWLLKQGGKRELLKRFKSKSGGQIKAQLAKMLPEHKYNDGLSDDEHGHATGGGSSLAGGKRKRVTDLSQESGSEEIAADSAVEDMDSSSDGEPSVDSDGFRRDDDEPEEEVDNDDPRDESSRPHH